MEKPIVPREIRTVYEGRLFTLQIETLTLPKGHELKAEIIRHPGSVVIIPVTDAGEIILVRQYRPAIGRWAWELPAGSLKPGEDVAQAAARECQEEIGLIPKTLEKVGAFYPTPGYCD
jgi:ADP-ribose pyrophosphatase